MLGGASPPAQYTYTDQLAFLIQGSLRPLMGLALGGGGQALDELQVH